MKKVCFIFPGQGSQKVGMGKDFYDNTQIGKEIFTEFSELIGKDLIKLCFDSSEEELKRTDNTQPAVYTVSMIMDRLLKENGIQPEFVAGHSLGELSACASAGVYDIQSGIKLVANRGKLMNKVSTEIPGKMTAVIGIERATLEELCYKVSKDFNTHVVLANINTPVQYVISGTAEGVEKAGELASEYGAKRVIPLPVSGAFHSGLMQPIAEEFKNILEDVRFDEPAFPIIQNVNANPMTNVTEIKENLSLQLTSPVEWVKSMQYVIEQGITEFIEVGNGMVLKGMMKKVDRTVNVHSIRSVKDIQELEL